MRGAGDVTKPSTGARGLADIAMAVLVVAIVATMIVPLPLAVLDLLLAVNLSLAVLLLLVALYVTEPLRIAAFPTILLVTTLYRLALDVAATRNILGRGDGGEVIRAFGRFVVQGNYVVGGVVFAILTLVQFLVIAKGSERVAEVAARFTLDAMPGKQMAIDAELRAGAIDQPEARRRRRALARESSFYGAMDGAMKFVKGDAIASIVIAFVNILGGLAIGVGQRGMSAGEALQRFGLMTIGEGLVAQIPALVVSTAAGILVTRVASEEPDTPLGSEIVAQLIAEPRALAIAGVMLAMLGLTPGLPKAPFFVLAAALGLGARAVAKAQRERRRSAELSGAAGAGAASASVSPRERDAAAYAPLRVPLSLELGEGHAGLVETSPQAREPVLRTLVPAVREELFRATGVPFPGVRVRVAGSEVPPRALVVRVFEVPSVEREFPPKSLFVAAPVEELSARGLVNLAQNATPDAHPADGSPGCWVDEAHRDVVERAGLLPLEASEFVAACLGATLRNSAALFVGLQETQSMLDALEGTHPALVRNVVPKPVTVPLLAEVLRRLAEEGVNLRDLREILEGIAGTAAAEKDPLVLAEMARQSLRRYLSYQHAPRGRLYAWNLAPEVSEAIRESVVRGPAGTFLQLDPQLAQEIRESAARTIGPANAVLLADPDVRRFVWLLLGKVLPRLRVISLAELDASVQVEIIGTLGP